MILGGNMPPFLLRINNLEALSHKSCRKKWQIEFN
jgi:hypothetical protein